MIDRFRTQLVAKATAPGWLVVQMLGTLLIVATLITTSERNTLIWLVFGVGTLCWALFVLGEPRFPVVAAAMLGVGALALAPVVTLVTDSSGLVLAVVLLGRFAALLTVGTWTIVATGALSIASCSVVGVVSGAGFADVLGNPLGLLAAVLFGLNRRQHRVHLAQARQLLDQTQRAQVLQTRAAALDERSRISREIHDVLANSLGALGVQLEVAEAMLEKGDEVTSLAHVRISRKLAAEGLVEARNAVAALRQDMPSLPDALTQLCELHRIQRGCKVSFRVSGVVRGTASRTTASLLSAAREALTNADRHARGQAVTMTLDYTDDVVALSVSNRFSGEWLSENGFGLTGMHERQLLAGGTVTVHREGGVWTVVAEVPSEAPE